MASYIRRRKFLATLLGGAATWPLAVRPQQVERVRRIGVLMPYAVSARAEKRAARNGASWGPEKASRSSARQKKAG